jgi:hypothetical protein
MAVTIKEKRASKKRKLDEMSKAELEADVVAKAERLAEKRGTDPRLEEARLWEKIYSQPRPQLDFDGNVVKRDPVRGYGTKAEAKLHQLALTIQKREQGAMSYAQAFNQGLKEPKGQALSADFVREVNEGHRYEVAIPQEQLSSGFLLGSEEAQIEKARRTKRKDDAGGTVTLRIPDDEDEDEDEDDDEDDDDNDNGDDDRETRRKRVAKADLKIASLTDGFQCETDGPCDNWAF